MTKDGEGGDDQGAQVWDLSEFRQRKLRERSGPLRPPVLEQQHLEVLAELAVRMGLAEDPKGLNTVLYRGASLLTAHLDMRDEGFSEGPLYMNEADGTIDQLIPRWERPPEGPGS